MVQSNFSTSLLAITDPEKPAPIIKNRKGLFAFSVKVVALVESKKYTHFYLDMKLGLSSGKNKTNTAMLSFTSMLF